MSISSFVKIPFLKVHVVLKIPIWTRERESITHSHRYILSFDFMPSRLKTPECFLIASNWLYIEKSHLLDTRPSQGSSLSAGLHFCPPLPNLFEKSNIIFLPHLYPLNFFNTLLSSFPELLIYSC